ncbi:hypothetical protein [Trebonia sp.]|uniref:vWA domain-containing protein n=1 Tax=Trebonia sp. TaxID=2767075 RepID=UPI0026124ED6|nr:hypothetical protein [Trebonia sp.]
MSAHPADGAVRPVYVVIDASGSTLRGGFATASQRALPQLIDAAAGHPGLQMSVLAYGTRADTLVWLTEPADIELIPAVTPAGMSSLAAGLRLLADSVRHDASRLTADGVRCLPPAVLVLADGLPTDPAADLLDARSALDDALDTAARAAADGGPAGPVPVFAAPRDTDPLAVAGLRMTFEPLAAGTGDLAGYVVAIFARLLAGLSGS